MLGHKECARLKSAMQSKPRNSSWSRMALLAWVTVWMLFVPLVHVHPEVEHNHGDPGHVHHAVTHTVFSAPLECEYPAQHDNTCPSGTHQHVQSIGHHGHTFTHPEIEYSLVAPSAAPTIAKILHSLFCLSEDVPSPAPIVFSGSTSPRDVAPTVLFLATALPLRAPPVPLS
ncbi:MAG: hypothetical protein OJF50_000364 [Nitrospira sp.]|nr:hypothetical protein [Nitrospira sp.]